MKKKRYMTLLETLISLSLTAFLLSSLLQGYWFLEKLHMQWEKEKKEQFYLRYAESRIVSLLENSVTSPRDAIFYTTEEPREEMLGKSLVFLSDNALNIQPEFSQKILVRLFVDKEKRLSLYIWPNPRGIHANSSKFQREVLMEGVKDLHFSFYNFPDPEQTEWDFTNKKPPLIAYVTLELESGKSLTFGAHIPSSDRPLKLKWS